jgi:hypothetical protein
MSDLADASASSMDHLAHVAETEADLSLSKNSSSLPQKRKFVRSESDTLMASKLINPGEIEIDDAVIEPPPKKTVAEADPLFSISEKSVPVAVFGHLLK